MVKHIKANSISTAWEVAASIFPTDYKKDEESSKRAGYPIYTTTSTDESFSGFHISDLNTRLEVSMGGLVFDIEYDTAYMSWANKESANGSSYMMKWAYCTQQCNNYEANMLHAGADINMHYYKLRNVSFEDGAINGTLTFKQPLAVNSDGTLSKWSTATLTFKNGILISGAWSNG